MNFDALPTCLLEINPGCAVVFYDDEKSRKTLKRRIADEMARQHRSHEAFDIQIRWERTEDEWLVNRIVARRVNIGCADCYGVIIGDCNNIQSILERYFDLLDATSDEVVIVEPQNNPISYENGSNGRVCEEETKYLSRVEATTL